MYEFYMKLNRLKISLPFIKNLILFLDILNEIAISLLLYYKMNNVPYELIFLKKNEQCSMQKRKFIL